MEPDDAQRPLSVPLPERENENKVVGWPTTAMSSIIFLDYEEINDEFVTKRWGARPKEYLPWSVLNKDQAGGKVKISSTPTTAFVQYTTEELHQLDQPWCSQIRGQEGELYPTVPPLVYGITPQESLAGTDWERIFGEWCLFSSLQDIQYCNVLCTFCCVVFMVIPLLHDRF